MLDWLFCAVSAPWVMLSLLPRWPVNCDSCVQALLMLLL
ncbi:hypothetical protein BMG523Draft_04676, partial [Frankia sp. BMG5.23]